MATNATVVCIRGPSGSGKTSLAEALLPLLSDAGLRTGFLKRSHHLLDTPRKDSDRMARAGATVLLHDAGGAALFRRPAADLPALLDLLPPDLDVILVETFRPERYPVLRSVAAEPAAGETLLACFDERGAVLPDAIRSFAELVVALQRARAMAAGPAPAHRPHRCAGAILGRRLARFGAGLLGLAIPRADRRLHVVCENDGCAADAIAAATGCRPGNRTLRFTYHGKMAATLADTEAGRAVRVWAAGDCRATAMLLYPDMDRHLAQQIAYARLLDEELFRFRWVAPPALPGPRRRHLLCAACEEEVDGDAVIELGEAAYCQPCARAWFVDAPRAEEGGLP